MRLLLRSLVGSLQCFCLGGVLFPLSPALIVDECLHAAPFHDLALEPNKVDRLRDDMLICALSDSEGSGSRLERIQLNEKSTYLGQKVIAASRQSFMSIALERAGRQSHDNNGTLKLGQALQAIFFSRLFGRCGFSGRVGKDTNAIDPLQSANLSCGLESIHTRQLDVHEDQMEAATPPFLHRVTTIHGRLPPHLKSFDKRFKQLQIDRVVFHNKDTDGGYFGIQRGRRRVLYIFLLLCLASLALLGARGG